VYGTGVPDWATLPSYLSRDLNSDGRACVVVTNFGEESYVTTQELLLLTEHLKRGGSPDIVIFYDGFNDALIGMEAPDPRTAHYGFWTIKERAEGSFRGRFDFVYRSYTMQMVDAASQVFRGRGQPDSATDLRAKAVTVVDNYEANLNMASALSQAYNFRFYGFWQPTLLYGHKPLVPFERTIVQADTNRGARLDAPPVVAAYEEAERRAPKAAFAYLAGVFDSTAQPIYLDEAHLGPPGNELVASAIAKYLENRPAGLAFRHSRVP